MHDAIKLDAGEAQTARADADMHINLGLQRVLVVCRGVACTSEREQAVTCGARRGSTARTSVQTISLSFACVGRRSHCISVAVLCGQCLLQVEMG